jgi:hypothetical protein
MGTLSRSFKTFLSDRDLMKGNEFIKKVKKLAKERSIEARVDEKPKTMIENFFY